MKIISTVHKLLFFKTTELYTLNTKIWKNILSPHESLKKLSEYACKQLKYYQLRIRSEIGYSLEIVLNDFKCLTVSLPTEILILAIVPLMLASSVNLLCCQICTLLSPLLPEGTDAHIWKHIHQKD